MKATIPISMSLSLATFSVTIHGYQTRYHYQTQVEIPVTTADFYFPLFLGFLYATFLPLSTVFFFPSIFFVGMADFAILLVGCPVFTHLRKGTRQDGW